MIPLSSLTSHHDKRLHPDPKPPLSATSLCLHACVCVHIIKEADDNNNDVDDEDHDLIKTTIKC